MDFERYLIAKITQDEEQERGVWQEVREKGVKRDHFLDPELKRVYSYISDYARDYGNPPILKVLKSNFPNLRLNDSAGLHTDHLIGEIKKTYHLMLIGDTIDEALSAYDDGDVQRILTLMSQTISDVAHDAAVLRDMNLADPEEIAKRLERYEERTKDGYKITGIPSGFPTVDAATLGFQRKQLVTMVGPPKAGKSTMMLLSAMKAHERGLKPLLIGFEMTNDEQAERFDAIHSGVDAQKLRSGTMDVDMKAKLQKELRRLGNREKPFILSSDSLSTTTLAGVEAKVDQHKPDLLIVDGMYMMEDENGEPKNSSKALTNLTRGFKRLAMNKNIPVVITTQVLEWKMDKKRGVTTNSIGYSSSFAQDSDVVIGVENDQEEQDLKVVRIIASRNSPNRFVKVRWDWAKGEFEEIEDDGEEDADAEAYHQSGKSNF